ncbi:hypothetical protein GX441_01920 [bacterium]|nr:hypothetical protein [bacterium]
MESEVTHDSGINAALMKKWIITRFGEGKLESILSELSAEAGTMLEKPSPNEWYPAHLLTEIYLVAHKQLGKDNPRILLEYGRFAAEESTSSLLRYLVRFISMDTAINRMRAFWKHYHKGGEIKAKEMDEIAGRKRRLISISGYFPGEPGCQVQEGYFLYIAEKTGVSKPRVEKKTCVYHGDSCCSWEVSWE